MPLCARCIGIHFGFLASVSFLLLVGRGLPTRLPTNRGMLVLSALGVLFLVDALLSYSGLSESTNLRRTLSGLALGTGVPFVVLPLARASGAGSAISQGRLDDRRLLLALVPSYAVSACVILSYGSSRLLFYSISVLGIVGMVGFLLATWAAILSQSLEDWHVSRGARFVAAGAATVAMMSLLILAHSLI